MGTPCGHPWGQARPAHSTSWPVAGPSAPSSVCTTTVRCVPSQSRSRSTHLPLNVPMDGRTFLTQPPGQLALYLKCALGHVCAEVSHHSHYWPRDATRHAQACCAFLLRRPHTQSECTRRVMSMPPPQTPCMCVCPPRCVAVAVCAACVFICPPPCLGAAAQNGAGPGVIFDKFRRCNYDQGHAGYSRVQGSDSVDEHAAV